MEFAAFCSISSEKQAALQKYLYNIPVHCFKYWNDHHTLFDNNSSTNLIDLMRTKKKCEIFVFEADSDEIESFILQAVNYVEWITKGSLMRPFARESDKRFSRVLMTMGILIFHIDVPLAPDGVTSKTVFPEFLTVISIEFYLGSQTRLIFAFILTEEFWKNCFRRHAVWSQRNICPILRRTASYDKSQTTTYYGKSEEIAKLISTLRKVKRHNVWVYALDLKFNQYYIPKMVEMIRDTLR
ncbi:hypothetical protein PRIPAC_94855 [Pristionchus pacificus]|uniref:Uncharacterized protein n=1 Tax=Pristionchus pacificus TaxID=54126 RepID=A0A2A6BAR7_PRIPA|nr:hypothetical protein PRIPAC_94855 [Pristionchus pacificus]|eukprot:PDM62970.1 hypothetical protein PRIPAC_50185 [Pristionchus pacificus]